MEKRAQLMPVQALKRPLRPLWISQASRMYDDTVSAS